MNVSQALNSFMNPLLMWHRLAWKTGEMAIASAQVIGRRTSRIALAGSAPSARDQREFAMMGQEKRAAALQAAQAAGTSMLMLNGHFAELAFKQTMSMAVAMMSLAASRTAAETARLQSKLLRDTTTRSVAAASKLSGAAAEVARRAMNPVHARVRSNVRRLGRKSG